MTGIRKINSEALAEMNIDKSWTLFLDRDGVINRRLEGRYVTCPEELEILPGVLDAIRIFSNYFGRIIIVTNQQGIAKGLMSVADLERVHSFLLDKIDDTGGRLDAFFVCAVAADEPDNCRKPSTQLGLQAKKSFPEIDFEKSIMVGDMPTDIEFGRRLGMQTVLIEGEQIPDFGEFSLPHFRAGSLWEIAMALECRSN